MKTGKSLADLATELERQANSKKDFIADTRALALDVVDEKPILAMQNGEIQRFSIGEVAHDQIGEKVQIPAKYYDRMLKEAPALLADNVNHWFRAQPGRHMVRTLDGRARAFLSDRYRPLDNFDLAEIALPVLTEAGCEVISCEVTEKRFYLKAVNHRVQKEVKVGDVVEAGLSISNSEVGLGAILVDPFVHRLICLNGAIVPAYGMRKHHVGKAGQGAFDDLAAEFFRDETRLADDKAFWLKVRDVIRAAMQEATFNRIVERWREATEQKIVGDPIKAVEVAAVKFQLNDSERSGVLRHLISGGDLSAYGLLNAITRTSQDLESYDRATELEKFGPRVLELPKKDWQEIAEAA